MYTNQIYCFGDGYALGHIWPEWPQILQALLPDYTIVNTAGIGAGPEWLVTQLVHQLPDISNSRIVWQWPTASRFDKLVEDENWHLIATNDPVYHFNLHTKNNQTWWLSSGSQMPEVKKYHSEYVQPRQHQQRLINYQTLVEHTLKQLNCPYIFFSTQDQETYSQQQQFLTTRQKEIQPSPIVHFKYCVEQILPKFNLTSRYKTQLELLITDQKWVPYDPDREEIWSRIKGQLQTLTDK
jgi:hypothetical protein